MTLVACQHFFKAPIISNSSIDAFDLISSTDWSQSRTDSDRSTDSRGDDQVAVEAFEIVHLPVTDDTGQETAIGNADFNGEAMRQ